MDYEKKYNEALERAKKLSVDGYLDAIAVEEIFPPEESEDEMIRKKLYHTVMGTPNDSTWFDGTSKEAMLAWLEEQKDKNCLACDQHLKGYIAGRKVTEEEKQKEQKKPTLDDPGIYGDWDKDLLEEIHSWLGNLDGKYTPYTIDDIKLTARHFVEWQKQKEQKPISQEDFDTAKHEALWEEQKPAECIEDSVKFEEGFKTGRESGLRDGQKYVLNNLDSYGLCKVAEWSEEDEDYMNAIIAIINRETALYPKGGATEDLNNDLIAWLKSLRPQKKWKPSEEQMEALEHFIRSWGESGTMSPQNTILCAATSLLTDLKKLL